MVTPGAVFSSPGPSGRKLFSPFWSNGVWTAAGAAGGPASRPAFVFYRLDEAFCPLLTCHCGRKRSNLILEPDEKWGRSKMGTVLFSRKRKMEKQDRPHFCSHFVSFLNTIIFCQRGTISASRFSGSRRATVLFPVSQPPVSPGLRSRIFPDFLISGLWV
jgi:hypothetical protein